MFQEKLIITDSSWLPRKYTARTWVPCKYSQQIHLVMPATRDEANRKRLMEQVHKRRRKKITINAGCWAGIGAGWCPWQARESYGQKRQGDTEVITPGEVTERSWARRKPGPTSDNKARPQGADWEGVRPGKPRGKRTESILDGRLSHRKRQEGKTPNKKFWTDEK